MKYSEIISKIFFSNSLLFFVNSFLLVADRHFNHSVDPNKVLIGVLFASLVLDTGYSKLIDQNIENNIQRIQNQPIPLSNFSQQNLKDLCNLQTSNRCFGIFSIGFSTAASILFGLLLHNSRNNFISTISTLLGFSLLPLCFNGIAYHCLLMRQSEEPESEPQDYGLPIFESQV